MVKVFSYSSYRQFLRDYIKSKKPGIKKKMAMIMGISPSLFSQILKGDRSLSKDDAFELATYLDFNSTERQYWLLLFDYDLATTAALKSFYQERLRAFTAPSDEDI